MDQFQGNTDKSSSNQADGKQILVWATQSRLVQRAWTSCAKWHVDTVLIKNRDRNSGSAIDHQNQLGFSANR